MNILNRFTKVLFEHYYKNNDAFVAGFVARNILSLILILCLFDFYKILDLLGIVPDITFETAKERKIILFSIFITLRLIIEFVTKNNKYFEESIASEEGSSSYSDKYDLVWIAVVGFTIFIILLSL